ncbi:MAG: hypothetical protein HRT95_05710 [Moritella sp.]|uniref:hypothetical protein n=1 Tax=Moritella sp. TaxID=78556 RepID=UPI001D8737D1|nr:hypothetical protein [Moritella sp.]NQZ49687.1 hypothetical protein [Moritella sp.]
MRTLGLKILEVLGLSLTYLLFGAALCYGVAWVIKLFALDYLIENEMVSNVAEFWVFTKNYYVLIMMPPIYILIFRSLPKDFQDDVTGVAKGSVLTMLYFGDWIGKGILLALGAYILYSTFII